MFASAATNLVASDTNAVTDIFLRDRDTDADGIFDEAGAVSTTRLSLGPSAAQADGPSSSPVISADGRYVAFVSTATNLVAGANAFEQIYRVDRTTGDVVRVSENVDGAAGDAASATPVIDANGDVIAFQSMADNLDGGANSRRRSSSGQSRPISPRGSRSQIPRFALRSISYFSPSISADGNRIAYQLRRTGLGPIIMAAEVFDRANGTATDTGFGFIQSFTLSASGREVVARGDASLRRQVVDTGAEVPPLNAPTGNPAIVPAVSPSVRYVLTEGAQFHDFDFGISTSLGFVPGGGDFSDDDRWLAVVSGTNNLVAGDANGVDDVFVLDLPDVLDADNDTMDDRWETLFGVTDPAGGSGRRRPDQRAGRGRRHAPERPGPAVPGGRRDRDGSSTPPFRSPIRARRSPPRPSSPSIAVTARASGGPCRCRQDAPPSSMSARSPAWRPPMSRRPSRATVSSVSSDR